MTTICWVVGRGGLLGSQVAAHLGHGEGGGDDAGSRNALVSWQPEGSIPWSDVSSSSAFLDRAASRFARAIAERADANWAVLWCAGAGVVGTSAEALDRETGTWRGFLESLGTRLTEAGLRDRRGFVFLASSAGGVHAGCSERPVTERSPARPTSAYGRAKLAQEEALAAWAAARPDVSTLVARISNLYGPGQKMDKPQGLVSHMSRTMIHRQAIHIYVPLDTIRDYVFAGDAGRWIAGWLVRLIAERSREEGPKHLTKICAAEEETTIAALIALFRRIAKRNLKIISGIHPVQGQQPLKLQFRSVVWPGEPATTRTTLLDGIARVYRHQLRLYEAGELPPPSRKRV